jgi:hypothetical protein
MPNTSATRDRKEALRLLVAAAAAILLLIIIGGAGIYYLVGLGEGDPFAPGLGLKNAAIVSFGVSLVVILVMAVVSGGDAIFGELPSPCSAF